VEKTEAIVENVKPPETTGTRKKVHKGLFLAYLGTSWFFNMIFLGAVHDHPTGADNLIFMALGLAVLNLLPGIFLKMSFDEAS
jgi:hypothetical protein